jgi:hypothetical protein
MSDHREPDLRDRFAALRREEEQGAPPFAAVRQAARAHRRRPASRRWLLAPVSVAAALCLLLVWLTERTGTPPPAPPGASLALADWRPPTDFLLQTPGREILAAPDWLEWGFTAEVPDWGLSTSLKERRNRS